MVNKQEQNFPYSQPNQKIGGQIGQSTVFPNTSVFDAAKEREFLSAMLSAKENVTAQKVFRRLKKEHLLANSTNKLLGVIKKKFDPPVFQICFPDEDVQISRENWLAGICFAANLGKSNVTRDELARNEYLFYKKAKENIYIAYCIASCLGYGEMKRNECCEIKKKADELAKTVDMVKVANIKDLVNEVDEIEEESRQLEERWKKEKSTLQNELAFERRERLRESHEASAKLQERDEEIQHLRALLVAADKDTLATEAAEAQNSEAGCTEIAEESKEELLDLPEQKVFFLGGNENMVKVLRQRHRGWTFAENTKSRAMRRCNVDLIVYWWGCASHKHREQVLSCFGNNDVPPIIYVTRTNIDCLELEMREKYTQLRKETEQHEKNKLG